MNNQLKKKIAFTGPFADVNFGDYAMLVNNIYDLDAKDVTLFSYDDVFLSRIQNDYLNKFNVEIVEVKLHKKSGNETVSCASITPIELLHKVENYQEIVARLEDIDVLIVNGGGYFNGLWSMPHRIERLTKIIIPILIANRLGKEIFFTGNSYGPFEQDANFFTCFFGVLENTTLGCRDNLYSPMWLKQIGVDDKKLKYIPDDLFVVNESLLNKSRVHAILAKKYIVMETYLPLDFIKSNLDFFKNFSERLFNKYGLAIVFLPFNLGHGGLDQAEYLASVFTNYEYFDISKCGYLPIQDTFEIIRNAELVISTRYHAFVVALSVGTPAISVLKDVMNSKSYYYNKNYGMLKQVLKDIAFDERYYLRLDYLDAIDFVAENFTSIVEFQRRNYNATYVLNKNNLNTIRKNFLKCFATND